MPKAKPDQTIVHRIELQQSERDTLEAALAGRFVTNAASAAGNLLTGIGAALAPFRDVFGALAVLWIADRTLDEIKETWDASIEAGQSWIAQRYGGGDYEQICAWLNAEYSNGGWEQILDGDWRNMEGAQFQSSIWRTGAYMDRGQYYYVINGNLTGPVGNNPHVGSMPQWLVDRFDIFISLMRRNARGGVPTSHPGELWTEFLPFSDYELWVVSSVHPR